jgi:hypothetical protein
MMEQFRLPNRLGDPIRNLIEPQDMGESYLPTMPATQLEFQAAAPGRVPCWRCRLHLRWPPWRKHWLCRKPPDLVYLDPR